MDNNTAEMNSKERSPMRNALKKLRAQALADYEEQRRQVVAKAFGPVLDDILAEAKPQDTDVTKGAKRSDKTSTTWPKIWVSHFPPTKTKVYKTYIP